MYFPIMIVGFKIRTVYAQNLVNSVGDGLSMIVRFTCFGIHLLFIVTRQPQMPIGAEAWVDLRKTTARALERLNEPRGFVRR